MKKYNLEKNKKRIESMKVDNLDRLFMFLSLVASIVFYHLNWELGCNLFTCIVIGYCAWIIAWFIDSLIYSYHFKKQKPNEINDLDDSIKK